jgi:hypothetical protein
VDIVACDAVTKWKLSETNVNEVTEVIDKKLFILLHGRRGQF